MRAASQKVKLATLSVTVKLPYIPEHFHSLPIDSAAVLC